MDVQYVRHKNCYNMLKTYEMYSFQKTPTVKKVFASFNSSFLLSESFNVTEINDISCPSLVHFLI